jgi:hypothetical protein
MAARKAATNSTVVPDGCPRTTHASDDRNVDVDQIVQRGREAAHRLINGTAFEDWIAVGHAVQVGRAAAMRDAGTNKPDGAKYAKALGRWLADNGLDKVAADKGMRSRLLELIDHLDDVLKWRKTLPANKQLEQNHPNTVWRHWKSGTKVSDPNKQHRPSAVAKLKEQVAALDEECARLKELNGGNTFTAKDTARDVVRVLKATFHERKLKEIIRLLTAKEMPD